MFYLCQRDKKSVVNVWMSSLHTSTRYLKSFKKLLGKYEDKIVMNNFYIEDRQKTMLLNSN